MRRIAVLFVSLLTLAFADAWGGAYDTASSVVDSITASVARCHPAAVGERFHHAPVGGLDALAWGEGDEGP